MTFSEADIPQGCSPAVLLSMASVVCGREPGGAVRPDASAFELPIVRLLGGHLTGTWLRAAAGDAPEGRVILVEASCWFAELVRMIDAQFPVC